MKGLILEWPNQHEQSVVAPGLRCFDGRLDLIDLGDVDTIGVVLSYS
jgi:hypothetical protein